MMNSKVSGLLGLARRAGKLSLGHDAAAAAVQNGEAGLCLLAADASERLCGEFSRAVQKFGDGRLSLLKTDYTMEDLGQSIGYKKTAVLTVNDRGFAERITELIGRE